MQRVNHFLYPHFRNSASDSLRRFVWALSHISALFLIGRSLINKRPTQCPVHPGALLYQKSAGQTLQHKVISDTDKGLSEKRQQPRNEMSLSFQTPTSSGSICEIEPLSGARSPWGVSDVMALRNWQGTSGPLRAHTSSPFYSVMVVKVMQLIRARLLQYPQHKMPDCHKITDIFQTLTGIYTLFDNS